MAKKKKRIVGDFLKIPLGDGTLSYGRVLEDPLCCFYNYKSKIVPELTFIQGQPLAFKVWVMNYAITDGDWEVIGNLPLEDELKEAPKFFKQDPINRKLSIYHMGTDKPATIDECEGLECAAVWNPEHVVDRLVDMFDGKPNKWVDSMKPKRKKP